MKKILSILLILSMLFGFVGCIGDDVEEDEDIISEDVKEDDEDKEEKKEKKKNKKDGVTLLNMQTREVGDYEYDYNYSQEIASLSYNLIYLSDDDAEKYPELSAVLNASNEETEQSLTDEYEEYKEWAYEQYADMPEYFSPYEVKRDVLVRRADSNVLSLIYSTYTYTGGAHGHGGEFGENFDTKTGERLLLSDVVTNVEEFYGLVAENIDEEALFPGTDVAEVLREYGNDVNFTLENSGITVCFNPYEIGPYSSGIIKVYLSAKEYPGIINEKYLKGAESFAVSLGSNGSYEYDVTGDGYPETISYYAYNSWDSEGYIGINVGEERYEESSWFYSDEAYFVHMKNGKNYIVAEYGYESDYREIVCYEIGDRITKLETVEGGLAYVSSDDEVYKTELLTNPESFNIDKRYSDLGTSSGYAEHFIDDEGNIRTTEKLWHITWQQEATVCMEFEGEVYKEEKDRVRGKHKFREGDTVKIYAWDDEGYSYLLTEEGKIVRVFVDNSSWPRTIDGMDVDEIFEGLMYAG